MEIMSAKPLSVTWAGGDFEYSVIKTFWYKTLEESSALVPRAILRVKEVLDPECDLEVGDIIFEDRSGTRMCVHIGDVVIYDPIHNRLHISPKKKKTRFEDKQG